MTCRKDYAEYLKSLKDSDSKSLRDGLSGLSESYQMLRERYNDSSKVREIIYIEAIQASVSDSFCEKNDLLDAVRHGLRFFWLNTPDDLSDHLRGLCFLFSGACAHPIPESMIVESNGEFSIIKGS